MLQIISAGKYILSHFSLEIKAGSERAAEDMYQVILLFINLLVLASSTSASKVPFNTFAL